MFAAGTQFTSIHLKSESIFAHNCIFFLVSMAGMWLMMVTYIVVLKRLVN